LSMIFWDGDVCAERIFHAGQEKGEARSGDYARALRHTRGEKSAGPTGCALADARCVAALDRWHRIALRAAPCGSAFAKAPADSWTSLARRSFSAGGSHRQHATQAPPSQKIML
jgi:hypothetical protein